MVFLNLFIFEIFYINLDQVRCLITCSRIYTHREYRSPILWTGYNRTDMLCFLSSSNFVLYDTVSLNRYGYAGCKTFTQTAIIHKLNSLNLQCIAFSGIA